MTRKACGFQGARFTRSWRREEDAVRLCRAAQRAKREAPHLVQPVCRKLREALSGFGREEPEARIRSRACGCPV